MNSNNSNEYDYIIIGAGMSGLYAGIKLSSIGYSVMICESHSKAGGYVHSFKRKRVYNFDSAVRIVAGAQGGLLGDLLDEIEIRDTDKFLKQIDNIYRVVTPDFEFSTGRNLSEFKENLLKSFPQNDSEINLIIDSMLAIYKETLLVQKGKLEIFETDYLKKYSNVNFYDFLAGYTSNVQLIQAISALWTFFGTIPEKASTIYYAYAIMAFFVEGAYYSEGTFETLTTSLVNKFKANGGVLKLRTEVAKIIVEDNVAKGVALKRKNEIVYAKRGVISSGDFLKAINNLTGTEYFPKRFVSKINKLKLPLSVFQTYIVTTDDVSFSNLAHENYYIQKNDNFSLEKDFYDIETPITSFCLSIPNHKENIIILSTFVPYMNVSFWKVNKKAFEKKLIEAADQIIPDLDLKIVFSESSTPTTNERYTLNSGGSPFGWDQSVEQFSRRPNYITPIEKLYAIGHWTKAGGGVVSAMLSAKQLIDILENSMEDFRGTQV
jgi:BH1848 protein